MKNERGMAMNERERLARTLQAEAGNQGYGGMMDVGSVIFNRVSSGRFGGDDLRSVIMKPGQFSVWNVETGHAGGEQGRDMSKVTPSEDAYRAADALMSGNYEDNTGGATHYYAGKVPYWAENGSWTQRGAHFFGNADNRRAGNPVAEQVPEMRAPLAPETSTTSAAISDTGEVSSIFSDLARAAVSEMVTPTRRRQITPPPMRRVPFKPITLIRK